MLCEEVRPSLSAYVDDCLSLSVRTAVNEHLMLCPVCRDELVTLRTLTRNLRSLTRPEVPADLAAAITDSLAIEAAATRQSQGSLINKFAHWLEPKLMPYTVGSFASVILFVGMFASLRPHIVALHEAAASQRATIVNVGSFPGYDLTQPVTPQMFSAQRAPYAEHSPTLNPDGALAALTSAYANPHPSRQEDADDMIVVADVFSNGAASLADVVQPPRDRRMLEEFAIALRRNAAFVPASMDRRPDTMRVVFTVQKVDVHERNF
ncbi:MAG TPA: zf-HC2 domain-containing protein [Pyrinomonadaceae bacterium]|nr:zf-HC2 domain-containing protein [Pyrinomonadaceae bacterium]